MSFVVATLAIDVGASKIAGALVGADFEILHKFEKSARKSLYGIADPDLAITKAMITELLEVAKSQGIHVKNGGACFAEYVTPDQLLNSKDQIGWEIQPKDDFATLTGFEWNIESDVRAMARAEAQYSGISDFLFVTISSGISHVLMIDGKPWVGATGEAIGFGITQIDNSKDSPTLEQFSSGMGITRRFQNATNQDVSSTEEVFAIYNLNEAAKKIIDSASSVLGKALAAFVDYLDPAKIVIGGGLWLGSEQYRSMVIKSYDENASKRRKAPQILSSTIGKNAAVIGAAIAAK
jgi:glucokinase